MSNIKIVRYIVENPNEVYGVGYNASLGKNALAYAIQNASRYFGKIMQEDINGQITLYKSYGGK